MTVAPASDATGHFRLPLTLAVLQRSGWTLEQVADAAKQAAGLLVQCGIAVGPIELYEIEAPTRFRSLNTPVSREMVKALLLPKPTVFFVAGTLHQPAFDAEAIGRGNSRTRPEMADTVWVAAGTHDLGLVIAHELAHVLADSGAHSNEPGNLMNENTSPVSTRLTQAQCSAMRSTAHANGLLQTPPR
jgi:hypothetical protein